MKLQLVPAAAGVLWVRQGMRTFWRQPIAMTGLFFMFMGLLSLFSLLPVVGAFLGLVALPVFSLGLMAATRQADIGQFPMPSLLISGLRGGAPQTRHMLMLGVLYALCFSAILGLSALADNGQFAKLYLFGGTLDLDTLMEGDVQTAMWLSTLLYLPLSLVFWHAPALVHWYGVAPVKGLFFSAVACLRNWRAFLVFGLVWLMVVLSVSLIITLAVLFTDGGDVAKMAIMPAMLLLAAMFFCSIYFSFRDCFLGESVMA